MGTIIKEFTSMLNTSIINLKMAATYTFQVEVKPELIYYLVGEGVGD
jgi:hypothetical protein